MQGRKIGFKHSDTTIQKMKIKKAENTKRKTEIEIGLKFIHTTLTAISKNNHSVSLKLLKQFEEIIKNYVIEQNDKEIQKIIDTCKQSITLNNDEIFDKLFEIIGEEG